jgi:superfamily II DNA or RNA helicase
MILHPDQTRSIDASRVAMRTHDRICLQAPTGFGKTVVASEVIKRITGKGLRVWFMVPRIELLNQASKHLLHFGVNHGRIAQGGVEQKGVKAHVVSKDTLIRRYDKIETPPDYLLIDECHIALNRQAEIIDQLNNPQVIGLSATPEQYNGDSMGLVYQHMVPGPSLLELVEAGRLSEPRIFCPPIEGIDKLHRTGTEYKADEFDQFLEERKVYGDAVKHYSKHAPGRPAIIFTRDVASSKKVAQKFRDADYKFESIDGSMSHGLRKSLLDRYRSGALQGLVSCQLLTYGVDLPTIEYIGLLRLTLSKALWYQMIGRGLRVSKGKDACLIFDHVNNFLVHGHPLSGYEWQFWGRQKITAKRDPKEILKLCPQMDFMYCTKPSCIGCEYNENEVKKRKEMFEDTDLQEVKGVAPVKLNDRPTGEKREIMDQMESAKAEYTLNMGPGPVGELLKLAEETGRSPIWIYWYLSEGRKTVNVKLLFEIARQKNYKKGWAYWQKKEIEKKLGR